MKKIITKTTCDCCGRDIDKIDQTTIGNIKSGSLIINYISVEPSITQSNTTQQINGELKMDDLCGSCLNEIMGEIRNRKQYLKTFYSLK